MTERKKKVEAVPFKTGVEEESEQIREALESEKLRKMPEIYESIEATTGVGMGLRKDASTETVTVDEKKARLKETVRLRKRK